MRKVLLVDDLRDFRVIDDTTSVTIARTSAAALEILKNDSVWDEIWLDHDLGKPEGVLDSTLPVLDYLSEKSFFSDPVKVGVVYVHTSNGPGMKTLIAGLERFGYNCVQVEPEPVFIVDWKNK